MKDPVKFVKDLAAVLRAHEVAEFGLTDHVLAEYLCDCLDSLKDVLHKTTVVITRLPDALGIETDWHFCVGCGVKYFSPKGAANGNLCDRCKGDGEVILK